jgi:sugar phosphate isomerase/epimerase
MNRRQFLIHSSLTASAVALPSIAAAEKVKDLPYQFCTFTKSLQHLAYDRLAEVIAPLGFDGIEVPIRPQGHIEPAQVEVELPKMAEALAKRDLKILVMTSGINEVSQEQRAEAVLKTAAGLGIKRFRMFYYKYDLTKPIKPQLDEFRPRLRDLVALARELGIKPVYQNHSGRDYVGAPVWDLHELLAEFDPADVGVAFDIGHATIEGAKCWPLHWALIRPYIDTVYVKEPHWGPDQRPEVGPLGEGGIDKAFYKTLKKSYPNGLISLHIEYFDHRDPALEPAFLDAVKKDFATLKRLIAEA